MHNIAPACERVGSTEGGVRQTVIDKGAETESGPQPIRPRSLWLREALATEPPEPASPPLPSRVRVDACILGGGYLGLWTALFLKDLDPSVDVAIVEADICGAGASGRNGGFALSWWSKLSTLVEFAGEEEGLWLARESEAAVGHIATIADASGIDCDYRRSGWLWVASSAAQADTWSSTVEACRGRGLEIFEALGKEEVQLRTGSRRYLSGVLDSTAARVQPALLARGLRRVAIERGVRIFEGSRVVAVEGTGRLEVKTAAGTIEADKVVSALNAWTATALPQLRDLRRAYVPVASDMVATAAVPELLERLGWTGGEVVSDSRLLVNYLRATADGRIAFGRGGGSLGRFGRVDASFDFDARRASEATRVLHWLYPQLSAVPITHSWAGAVDRSQTGLPFFGRAAKQPRLVYGVGFSGNGVAPCVIGGRILASLVAEVDDRWASCSLARGPEKRFPPEPLLTVGGEIVRRAVRRKELREDDNRRPSRIDTHLAGLAPAGYFKIGSKAPTSARVSSDRGIDR